MLKSSIGSVNYNNLSAYLGLAKPIKDLTYAELVQNFKAFLSPKKSDVVAQHCFLNNVQKEQQTVIDYLTSLQKDIDECEFKIESKCNGCNKTSTVSANSLYLSSIYPRP